MYKLKSILVSLVLLSCFMFLYSCDNESDDIETVDEYEYQGAFEEIEQSDGNIKKNRRIGVVREIIKASQDDPTRMEVDREKLGIE
ncbi:MAG: hypothetical protein ACR2NW_00120 [Thermodesulfobacteriota bacterium]